MNGVIADTHAIIWYLTKSNHLSRVAFDTFESTIRNNEIIYVSAITIVAIVYLVEKGKIPESAFQRLTDKISADDSSLEIAPLDLSVSQKISSVPRDMVPDMPDRIIAATALSLNIPLITRDSRIRTLSIPTIW